MLMLSFIFVIVCGSGSETVCLSLYGRLTSTGGGVDPITSAGFTIVLRCA